MGTISDKSAYLNTTKTLLREKINDLGQDLDEEDTFRSYVEALEEVWNDYPKVTATDVTEATLNGTKAGKMKLDIKGNSTQDTTEGYNLLDNQLQTTTKNGVTATVNTDKSIKFSGGASSASGAEFNLLGSSGNTTPVLTLPAGTYRLYTGLSVSGVMLNVMDTSNALVVQKHAQSTNPYITFTLSVARNIGRVYVFVTQSASLSSNPVMYPMIVSGDSDKTYELYTDGPSPNPSYPQPINSAGDNINLFDKDSALTGYEIKGSDGTTITNAYYYVSDYIRVEPNTSYVLSGKKMGGSNCFYNQNKEYISTISNLVNGVLTTPDNPNVYYIRFNAQLTSIDTTKFEKGTKASNYSPYGEGSIEEVISNKNIVNLERFFLTTVGVTGTISSPNDVTIKGTGSWSNIGFIFKNIKKNQDYIMSANFFSTLARKAGLSIYGTDTRNSSDLTSLDSNTFDLSASTKTAKDVTFNSGEYKYIFFRFWNNATGTALGESIDLEVSDVMLEEGSTATTYVAHLEQNFIIPCQRPMRKIGDAEDIFFKNVQGSEYYDNTLTENAWYERHLIDRYTITGEEIFNKGADATLIRYEIRGALPLMKQNASRTPCMSNHFHYLSSGNGVGVMFTYWIYSGSMFVYLNQDITTVNGAKAYFQQNETYVDYLLETPTNLPCTTEQTTALEALLKAKSYEDTTIIYSEDGTPAYLNAEALKA